MKKALSLILALALMLCAVSSAVYSAEEAAQSTDLTVRSANADSMSITGESGKAHKFTVAAGSGENIAISNDAYPVANLSFDFGFNYSSQGYGIFGITKKTNVEDISINTDDTTLRFHYATSGGRLVVFIKWVDGRTITIADVTSTSGHPYGYGGNGGNNISYIGFVKQNGHWRLSIDGYVCNSDPNNEGVYNLDLLWGNSFFDNSDPVHIFMGGISTDETGNGYFKECSTLSPDRDWQIITNDYFSFNQSGWREYRQEGLNSKSDVSDFTSASAAVTGNRADGYNLKFGDSANLYYYQTAEGFDLKSTVFEFRMNDIAQGNQAIKFAFSINPASILEHDTNARSFLFTGIASGAWRTDVSVTTEASHVFYNTFFVDNGAGYYSNGGCGAIHRGDGVIKLRFAKAVGPDEQEHWYLQYAEPLNNYSWFTVKGSKADATDKYFQFDEIIDQKVYFAIGNNGALSDITGVKVLKSDETTLNWSDKAKLPTISAGEENRVAALQSMLLDFGGFDEDAVIESIDEAVAIRDAYAALSDNAKKYLSDVDIEDAEAITEFLSTYEVSGDLNGDYTADIDDLNLIKSSWLNDEYNEAYDLDADGEVNILDAVKFVSDYL